MRAQELRLRRIDPFLPSRCESPPPPPPAIPTRRVPCAHDGAKAHRFFMEPNYARATRWLSDLQLLSGWRPAKPRLIAAELAITAAKLAIDVRRRFFAVVRCTVVVVRWLLRSAPPDRASSIVYLWVRRARAVTATAASLLFASRSRARASPRWCPRGDARSPLRARVRVACRRELDTITFAYEPHLCVDDGGLLFEDDDARADGARRGSPADGDCDDDAPDGGDGEFPEGIVFAAPEVAGDAVEMNVAHKDWVSEPRKK